MNRDKRDNDSDKDVIDAGGKHRDQNADRGTRVQIVGPECSGRSWERE